MTSKNKPIKYGVEIILGGKKEIVDTFDNLKDAKEDIQGRKEWDKSVRNNPNFNKKLKKPEFKIIKIKIK
jgi:hypothetical protein